MQLRDHPNDVPASTHLWNIAVLHWTGRRAFRGKTEAGKREYPRHKQQAREPSARTVEHLENPMNMSALVSHGTHLACLVNYGFFAGGAASLPALPFPLLFCASSAFFSKDSTWADNWAIIFSFLLSASSGL